MTGIRTSVNQLTALCPHSERIIQSGFNFPAVMLTVITNSGRYADRIANTCRGIVRWSQLAPLTTHVTRAPGTAWYVSQISQQFVLEVENFSCLLVNHIQKALFSFIMAFQDPEDAALDEGDYSTIIWVVRVRTFSAGQQVKKVW